jgi:hypothetical protein
VKVARTRPLRALPELPVHSLKNCQWYPYGRSSTSPPDTAPDIGVKRIGGIEHTASDAHWLKFACVRHVVKGALGDAQPLGGLFSRQEGIGAVRGLPAAKRLYLLSQRPHVLSQILDEGGKMLTRLAFTELYLYHADD